MSKAYCLAPFVHMNVANNGNVTPCCTSTRSFGSSKEDTLVDIWNSASMEVFRQEILGDKPVKGCEICYQLEKSGSESFRQRWNRSFAVDCLSDPSEKLSVPTSIHVHFSNICNLRCRMCWHGSSSSWFNESRKLGIIISDNALITSDGSQRMVDQMAPFIDSAKEFYFAGGEPLMMHQQYELLRELIERNRTDAKIGYNTNLTRLTLNDWDAISLWRKFEDITVKVSIDEVDKKTEYLRAGSDYSTILSNALKIREQAPNVRLHVCITVSLLNIFNLTNIVKRVVFDGICCYQDIDLNLVQEPDYYNIRLLPKDYKQEARRRIEEFICDAVPPESLCAWLKNVCSYMEAEDWSEKLSEFIVFNDKLDGFRQESFVDVFSDEPYLVELYKLVQRGLRVSEDPERDNKERSALGCD